MTLNQYLEQEKMTIYRFAKLVGCSYAAARNWALQISVPHDLYIEKIKKVTKGAVDYAR